MKRFSEDDQAISEAKAAIGDATRNLANAVKNGDPKRVEVAKKNLETAKRSADQIELGILEKKITDAQIDRDQAFENLRIARDKGNMAALPQLESKAAKSDEEYQSLQDRINGIVARMDGGLDQAKQTADFRSGAVVNSFAMVGLQGGVFGDVKNNTKQTAENTGKIAERLDKLDPKTGEKDRKPEDSKAVAEPKIEDKTENKTVAAIKQQTRDLSAAFANGRKYGP